MKNEYDYENDKLKPLTDISANEYVFCIDQYTLDIKHIYYIHDIDMKYSGEMTIGNNVYSVYNFPANVVKYDNNFKDAINYNVKTVYMSPIPLKESLYLTKICKNQYLNFIYHKYNTAKQIIDKLLNTDNKKNYKQLLNIFQQIENNTKYFKWNI